MYKYNFEVATEKEKANKELEHITIENPHG